MLCAQRLVSRKTLSSTWLYFTDGFSCGFSYPSNFMPQLEILNICGFKEIMWMIRIVEFLEATCLCCTASVDVIFQAATLLI